MVTKLHSYWLFSCCLHRLPVIAACLSLPPKATKMSSSALLGLFCSMHLCKVGENKCHSMNAAILSLTASYLFTVAVGGGTLKPLLFSSTALDRVLKSRLHLFIPAHLHKDTHTPICLACICLVFFYPKAKIPTIASIFTYRHTTLTQRTLMLIKPRKYLTKHWRKKELC